MPFLINKDEKEAPQPRLNIYRNRTKDEADKPIISGFPLKDVRHTSIKSPYGYANGTYIGFMDDNTPVRLYRDGFLRLSNKPDRVWFYLDNRMIKINLCKTFSSTPDKYGFCAYSLVSSQFFFSWFAIAKSLVGNYPIWANQYYIWPPQIKSNLEKYWYSLCFAFVLAENRCVVTKFEANNPVEGAPEVFVDNPLCPTNRESFWSTTLNSEIVQEPDTAYLLVEKVRELYIYWNINYCKGQYLEYVGLDNEPYFKYFDYPDFLTPYSGLIQIKKYADQDGLADLQHLFSEITKLTKDVKAEIYRLLVKEFKYFE